MRVTHPRRAFTLFQLLVLLAILALAFALFLPAVQKLREAAARTQSANNMKQLGLAVHNYYDANGSMPPGVDAKLHFSATAYLLPYIEQAAVYNQIDFKKSIEDKANLAVAALRLKVLINPMDPVEQVDKDFGGTNYLFNAGGEYALKDNDGVFYENSKTKFPDISDGTSNTMMIGETLKGDNTTKATDVRRQHVVLKKDDLKELNDESGVKDWRDSKNIAGDRGKNWMDGRFLQGTFTGTRKLNDEKPDVNCGGAGGLSGLRGISKGVNIAMCDGSVRFVNMDLELSVWKALATRNGGEVIPNF